MDRDKRRFVRKTVKVEFRGQSEEGVGELVFEGLDLSAGGTFLRSDLLLEQDEAFSLEFRVPGSVNVIRANARVAWVRRFPKEREQSGMGVEFVEISDEDREVVSRYLSSLGHVA